MLNIAPNNRLNVLLAHDSDGWQETVRRLLEPQGVQTVAVRSGREALDIMQNTQIHVAVLDQQMPHLGGLQVIKLMRDIKTAPPSILLTAHLTDHLLHEALGMHDFSVLSKP